MKYYIFDDGINPESVDKLVNFINNTDGEITISFHSTGGVTYLGDILVEILNKNKDRITLVAGSFIFSCAFYIFYMFEGTKRLSDSGTHGMVHTGGREIKTNDYLDQCIEKDTKQSDLKSFEVYKSIMTLKEQKDFIKKKDIVFGIERMKKIFNNA